MDPAKRAQLAKETEGRSAFAENAVASDSLLQFLTSKAALIAGFVLALISIAAALREMAINSMDFQWSGARLLLEHRDPWAIYLAGDPHHEILLMQYPNYLHELFVLMLPFGFAPFSISKFLWAACNFAFVVILAWSVCRLCELDRRKGVLLFVLVLMSTPFRVTLGNGQNDALALMAIGLWAWTRSQPGRGLLLGISYEKYSFPPVLVVFLLLRRRWKLLAASLVPPVAGFLIVKTLVPTGWNTLAIEPFLAATHKGSVSLGWANITAVFQRFAPVGAVPVWLQVTSMAAAIVLAVVFAVVFVRNADRVDGRILLACLLSASLVCFQHQIYDFLALIFSLGIALKSRPCRGRTVVLLGLAYFWYLERIFNLRHYKLHLYMIIPSFLIGLVIVIATYRLYKTTEWSSRWEI
jgi:hypothetical protein